MDNKGINVLSLFDGMSCGRIALERAGIKVYRYYASEIDKHAIKVSLDNWFDVVQIGSVVDLHYKDGVLFNAVTGFSVKVKIDLLIGGSPCQGFSFIGKMLNFEDSRSKLFFEYARLWNEIEAYNPKARFLLENVRMKEFAKNVISDYLFVPAVFICSSNFCAAKRKRFYWTNITKLKELKEVKTGILLNDVLEKDGIHCVRTFGQYEYRPQEKAQCLTKSYSKGPDNRHSRSLIADKFRYLSLAEIERAERKHTGGTWRTGVKNGSVAFPTKLDGKAKSVLKTLIIADRSVNHIDDGKGIRILTPIECERLQGVPDNYTQAVSNTQRYQMLGNGWQVDTIVHIFSFYKPC